MNEIGLSWCPDVRTEKNPRLSARDQALAPVEIRGHSHERELVAAQRDEVAVACWPSPRQDSHYFQPTDEAAALLAYALPPATAWRHDHERGKVLVTAGDRGDDIERVCWCSSDVCNDRRFGPVLRLLPEPCALYARDLQHRRADRPRES